MGGIRGSRDNEATGGEDSISGDNSFHFPVTSSDWTRFHSGGVGLLVDGSFSVRGFFGSRGVVRLGVIETIRGSSGEVRDSERSCNDDATGGDGFGVILGKGGMSHGRGIRSSEDGAVCLIGGSGTSSGVSDLFHGGGMIGVAFLIGGDGVSDWGKSMLTRSGVSFISTGDSYCSIDEYWRRCDPQGTRGSGVDATWGNSTGGGLG